MRVLPPLRRDGHFLQRQRLPREDLAVLQDGGAVAEDEVDGAGDAAFAVELPEGVGVESVLVPFHAAPEEGRLVGVDAEGHALVLLRPRRVAERHVPRDEPFPRNGYINV